jgi:hypothetical protein
MTTHDQEANPQGLFSGDRAEGRQEIQAHDNAGTAGEDASWPWKIPLTKGKFALVDEEDFERLIKFRWCLTNRYPSRRVVTGHKKSRIQYLHRFLMGNPTVLQIDHRNGNKLDNRKENLRLATNTQNNWNKGKTSRNTSGVAGVSWFKQTRKWHAQIRVGGKRLHLGYFSSLDEAAQARNRVAKEKHGEFFKP